MSCHRLPTSQTDARARVQKLKCVRLVRADDTIISVGLEVTALSPTTCEIRIDGSTIGYIGRGLHAFSAFAGTCPESATPFGKFDLWDQAAAALICPAVTAQHAGTTRQAS